MKKFRPENRLFCHPLMLQNSRFSGILVCAPILSHMVVSYFFYISFATCAECVGGFFVVT